MTAKNEMCTCYFPDDNPVNGKIIGCHLLPIGEGCGGFVTQELVNALKDRRNRIK